MMNRKWTVLGATMTAVTLAVAGLSWAADKEETPTGKIMEKINAKNGAIGKTVRTDAAWSKGSKTAATDADEMVKLFKEARELKDSAEKQKKPYEDWTKLMDAQIQQTEAFAEVARKPGTKKADAKASFDKVKGACADCHKVFRPDED